MAIYSRFVIESYLNVRSMVLTVGVISFVLLIGCSQPPSANSGAGSVDENDQQSGSAIPGGGEIRRKAEVGVGKSGQKLEKHNGIISTPVKTYFKVKEQLAFMNVDRALRMHEILNGYPKSHQEFMEKIIQANGIELPKLPAGHRYEYDPESHQLMVVQPADQ